jgi:CYTH domain-containing protein
MTKEIERKFLLNLSQAREFCKTVLAKNADKIFQGYFWEDDKFNEFRVRLSKTECGVVKAFFTVKDKLNLHTREEQESKLSIEVVKEILLNRCTSFIEKTKYYFDINGQELELQYFDNDLIIIEVEFSNQEQSVQFIPGFEYIKEVTNDEQYYCKNLATSISKDELLKKLNAF